MEVIICQKSSGEETEWDDSWKITAKNRLYSADPLARTIPETEAGASRSLLTGPLLFLVYMRLAPSCT